MHRRLSTTAWSTVFALFVVFVCGCRDPDEAVTADRLRSEFSSADPALRESASVAGEALQNRDFERAVKALNRTAARKGNLTPAQTDAVMQSYHLVIQAVDADPRLDTPALYRSMAELHVRLHGEN